MWLRCPPSTLRLQTLPWFPLPFLHSPSFLHHLTCAHSSSLIPCPIPAPTMKSYTQPVPFPLIPSWILTYHPSLLFQFPALEFLPRKPPLTLMLPFPCALIVPGLPPCAIDPNISEFQVSSIRLQVRCSIRICGTNDHPEKKNLKEHIIQNFYPLDFEIHTL